MLDELQKQNELLKLTPEQLKLVQDYNKFVNKEPSSISEWINQKSVFYDKVLGVLLSVIGVFIERWYERKNK